MYRTILLIDDDADDAELFQEALEEIDGTIDCYVTADAEGALQQLQQVTAQRPDIIFLDINMPGMNGWQCLEKLKASTELKQIPVIIYSTSSAPRDRDIAAGLGAVGLLTKPSDYRELIRALSALIRQPGENEIRKAIDQLND